MSDTSVWPNFLRGIRILQLFWFLMITLYMYFGVIFGESGPPGAHNQLGLGDN